MYLSVHKYEIFYIRKFSATREKENFYAINIFIHVCNAEIRYKIALCNANYTKLCYF